MQFILIAGAVLVLLTAAKAIAPNTFFFLPLGGSNISEMGIIFGVAVATTTILQVA